MSVVNVYEEPGLEGNSRSLDYGKYTNNDLTGLRDVRSLEIAPKVSVLLYPEDNFRGKERIYFNESGTLKVITCVDIPCNVKSIIVDCVCKRKRLPNVAYNVDVICKERQKIVYSVMKPKVKPAKCCCDFPTRYRPIVIIHDFGFDKDSWFCFQNKLASIGFESVVIDLRGHGNSSASENMLFAEMLEDVRFVAHHLNYLVQQPIVIGHGIGGFMAQLWAIKYKTEISKLILIGTAPLGTAPQYFSTEFKNIIAEWTNETDPISLKNMAHQYASLVYNECSSDECCIDKLKADLIDGFKKCNDRTLKRIFTQNVYNPDHNKKLACIKIPTLILHGSIDLVVAVDGSRKLDQIIFDSKFLTINCKGHAPQFTGLHATFVYVNDFIRSDKITSPMKNNFNSVRYR